MPEAMSSVEIAKPGGLDKLEIVEQQPPKPGPGEVLVNWRATSLNYHDLMVAVGLIPTADRRVPMSDGAGVVLEVGTGVSRWKPGDQVMSLFFPNWVEGEPTLPKMMQVTGDTIDGCATTHDIVAEHSITHMPAGYSFAEAATLPCAALTSWRALMVEAGLQAGQTVVVEGTGGMALFALQFAKAAGCRVIATTSTAEKAARLKQIGADDVLNYKEDAEWGKSIAKLTGGGAHAVLDSGGGTTLQQSFHAVRPGGHVSLIGVLGGVTAEILLPMLFGKQVRISGLAVGSGAMQEDMVRAIEIAGIKPIISHSFGLGELGEAFGLQQAQGHFGKIVVEYS